MPSVGRKAVVFDLRLVRRRLQETLHQYDTTLLDGDGLADEVSRIGRLVEAMINGYEADASPADEQERVSSEARLDAGDDQ